MYVYIQHITRLWRERVCACQECRQFREISNISGLPDRVIRNNNGRRVECGQQFSRKSMCPRGKENIFSRVSVHPVSSSPLLRLPRDSPHSVKTHNVQDDNTTILYIVVISSDRPIRKQHFSHIVTTRDSLLSRSLNLSMWGPQNVCTYIHTLRIWFKLRDTTLMFPIVISIYFIISLNIFLLWLWFIIL